MEFIEYYRIIRRRIWIIVVLAAVTSAVVVVGRLMPHEVSYPATGRMLVHDVAQRQVGLAGNEVMIGIPEGGAFWADLNEVLFSRQIMEAAADEMGIAAVEAAEQLDPPRAQRIGNSTAATIHVSATGVPSQVFDPNVSNARDMAVRYCDAVMATLDDVWRQRRMAQLQTVRAALEQRQPSLESENAQFQRRADEIASRYDGVPPTGVLDRLSAELAQIEQELAGGEVARGAAEARSQALSTQGSEIAARRAPDAEQPFVDPRVLALRQTILDKQIALDEELTARTEEHQQVQALQTTIQRLQERLAALEADPTPREVSPEASMILLQTQITADVETAALTRRLELLQRRAGEIRNSLPAVRADARVYEQIDSRVASTQADIGVLLDSIDRLDAEEDLLAQAPVFEILTAAEPGHVARGLGPFLIKLVGAAVAGAVLGVMLIFVLHYVDFSFQDEHEAERMLGVPVLVGIPRSDIPAAQEGTAPDGPAPADEPNDAQSSEPEA